MKLTLVTGALIASGLATSYGDWPAWRGPKGTGVSAEQELPLHWSTDQHVKWRVPLPDRGNSSPIVWGNRVFISQAIDKEGRRTVMCFDRSSGKTLWQSGVMYLEKEPTHATNPYCSASPVTDGERVVASFGSAGLYCYNFEGRELWHRDLGPQHHIWGNAASPVLVGDLCIQNVGPGERTLLVALDKKTGETVWEHDEPGGKFGQSSDEWIGSWTTPIVIEVGGRRELIMSYPHRVVAFDPGTGKELWECDGLGPLVYTSPLWGEGVIVAMSGYGGPALAVRPGGSGNVTATHRLWHVARAKQRIGSGVITGGHVYILDDPGVAECIDLQTGRVVWEERLKGPSPEVTAWSSMVLSQDRLYVANHAGDSFVLRAAPKFELLATNSLGERTLASHAVSDGEVFVRTYNSLWCIGDSRSEAGRRR